MVFSKAFLEVSCRKTPSCYERTEEQKIPPGTGNQTSDNKIKENVTLAFLIKKKKRLKTSHERFLLRPAVW